MKTTANRPVQLPLFGEPTQSRTSASRAPRRSAASPAHDPGPRHLFRRLSRLLGGQLASLSLTDNRRTILTVRAERRGEPAPLRLRLHRSFVDAPDEALQAVATFARSPRGTSRSREALATIREHFSRHCALAPAARRRRPVLRPAGEVYDLRELRDEINRQYFGGKLKVEITWGKAATGSAAKCRRRRAYRSTLQLGSYSYEDNLVRMHRVLDQPRVPRYVVEAVVYHELLHAAIPPEMRHGRRYVHTEEFRRRERLFRQLDRAEAWVERNLPELLRARAAARPERRPIG
jgi:SprT-like family